MPYANLVVAQAVAAWSASPLLAGFFRDYISPDIEPYIYYVIAVLGAVIIWIGGHMGARISRAIRPPTLTTLGLAVAFAVIGAYLAAVFFGPYAADSQAMSELFMTTPVATAILGYMLARGSEPATA